MTFCLNLPQHTVPLALASHYLIRTLSLATPQWSQNFLKLTWDMFVGLLVFVDTSFK
jgi:hypothetical protein